MSVGRWRTWSLAKPLNVRATLRKPCVGTPGCGSSTRRWRRPSARARSAGCLIEAEREAEAEALLLRLLDNDVITPQAQAFRGGLLQLCELLYQQERYGEAIGRLEDYLARYPTDAQRGRARFLRADAYRRSACQLRDAPVGAGEAQQYRALALERFRIAAELFAELETDFAAAADPDDETELYQRLALLCADCLLELNDRALEQRCNTAAARPLSSRSRRL